MINFFIKLFNKKTIKLLEVLNSDSTIIDVRTPQEYAYGHVKGSVNIPLDQLQHKLTKIKKYNTPLVLCCASGGRSANAVYFLKSKNIDEVYNGGRWTKVNRLLGY